MAHVPEQFDYTQLSVTQKLELIGDIWDSIPDAAHGRAESNA